MWKEGGWYSREEQKHNPGKKLNRNFACLHKPSDQPHRKKQLMLENNPALKQEVYNLEVANLSTSSKYLKKSRRIWKDMVSFSCPS